MPLMTLLAGKAVIKILLEWSNPPLIWTESSKINMEKLEMNWWIDRKWWSLNIYWPLPQEPILCMWFPFHWKQQLQYMVINQGIDHIARCSLIKLKVNAKVLSIQVMGKRCTCGKLNWQVILLEGDVTPVFYTNTPVYLLCPFFFQVNPSAEW